MATDLITSPAVEAAPKVHEARDDSGVEGKNRIGHADLPANLRDLPKKP